MLKVGEIAPDFEAPLSDGSTFRLSEALCKGPLVLYFYPKDFTPGCTREAQAFRERHTDILKFGASVIGINTDSIDSHQRFKKTCALSFQLATDPEGKVQETYGVRRRFPRQSTMRVTFLIDQAAVIRGAYKHEVAVRRHVADVLHDLEQMDKKNR